MESTGSTHRRNVSSKATLPRRATKGPLDDPDESSIPATDYAASSPTKVTSPSRGQTENSHINKNLSFLLRPEIYHPLTQLDVPPAFRSEFPSPPQHGPLSSSLSLLDGLLKEGRFLLAAHFSAAVLTSSIISQNDASSIFYLLYVRLACLELSGNTVLAAQEAKALEDLSSSFYYLDTGAEADSYSGRDSKPSRSQHIVPWPLRVLAVRLQSIGFGDSRRGIAGLYELGLEARRNLARAEINHEEHSMWKERLADLGIRVVNALIEMGDLDAARRSLANTKLSSQENDSGVARLALLNLRIGDTDAARELLNGISTANHGLLKPLLSMAEGRYADAADEWRSVSGNESTKGDETMILQNLAVCLLYAGKLNEARETLESLVENQNSFQSVTFNLATIYELCSENSNVSKLELTEKISKHSHSPYRNWEKPSVDFKV